MALLSGLDKTALSPLAEWFVSFVPICATFLCEFQLSCWGQAWQETSLIQWLDIWTDTYIDADMCIFQGAPAFNWCEVCFLQQQGQNIPIGKIIFKDNTKLILSIQRIHIRYDNNIYHVLYICSSGDHNNRWLQGYLHLEVGGSQACMFHCYLYLYLYLYLHLHLHLYLYL